MKIALGIEYDGSDFHGWQSQPNLRTIQKVVEQALSCIADHPIQVICAGRTDTGVHACNQVIHFETEAVRPNSAWILGTNSHLPKDVIIKWTKYVDLDFHARFSAIRRHYRYIIYNQPISSALFRNHFTHYPVQLNETDMSKAAQYLLGELDFSSFRSADCQSKSPFRNIETLIVTRHSHHIIIDIIANAFLHHMVRNIVGALLPIGLGKKPPHWIKQVLEARDRRASGVTAPASGLYLVAPHYPNEFVIPKPVKFSIFL